MKKTLLILIIIILIALGLVWYFQNQNTEPGIVDNNQNTNEPQGIDTSGWEIFEIEKLGISYRYPGDKYKIEAYTGVDQNETHYRLVSKDKEEKVITFYYHEPDYNPRRGAYFGDVNGFIYKDGVYKIVYGLEQYNKKTEVTVLEKINNEVGEIIIIDGTKFDYSGPSVGPGTDFAAVMNTEDNPHGYAGVAILPNDDILGYEEFLEIIKSISIL